MSQNESELRGFVNYQGTDIEPNETLFCLFARCYVGVASAVHL